MMTGKTLTKAATSLLAAFMAFAACAGTPKHALAAQLLQSINFSTSAIVSGVLTELRPLFDMDSGTANKFDPGLGSLDSIDISVSGTMTTQTTGSMTSMVPECPAAPVPTPCPGAFNLAFVGLSLQFTLPDFITTFAFGGRSDVCAPYMCNQELPALAEDFARDTTLSGTALDGYIGLGTIGANSLQNGLLQYASLFPLAFIGVFSGSMEADGIVRIVYNYRPPTDPAPEVPEPATLAILGLGLAGLGFMQRRRLDQVGP